MSPSNPLSEMGKELAIRCADFMGDTVGELIQDKVHFLRSKCANQIIDKAEKYHNDRKLSGKRTIPIGMAIRFMDSATLEEDPEIQDLWARLLANATDPSSEYKISKTHMALLSEMNSLDAKVLQHINEKNWMQFKKVAEATGSSPLDCSNIAHELDFPKKSIGLALGNLWRVGCLIQEPTFESGFGPSIAPNSTFRLSPLGNSLLQAVEIKNHRILD